MGTNKHTHRDVLTNAFVVSSKQTGLVQVKYTGELWGKMDFCCVTRGLIDRFILVNGMSTHPSFPVDSVKFDAFKEFPLRLMHRSRSGRELYISYHFTLLVPFEESTASETTLGRIATVESSRTTSACRHRALTQQHTYSREQHLHKMKIKN